MTKRNRKKNTNSNVQPPKPQPEDTGDDVIEMIPVMGNMSLTSEIQIRIRPRSSLPRSAATNLPAGKAGKAVSSIKRGVAKRK